MIAADVIFVALFMKKKGWLVGWLVGWFWFYGMSTFVGYLIQIHFYTNHQFYVKQFSFAWVLSLIVKNISISNNSFYSQF